MYNEVKCISNWKTSFNKERAHGWDRISILFNRINQRNHTGHCGMRAPLNSLFFPLGAEMGQTNHPGSPEDQFYESPRGKATFLPLGAGLLGQVITPPRHKGNSLRGVKWPGEGGYFFIGGARVSKSYCSKTSSHPFSAHEEVVLGPRRTAGLYLSALLSVGKPHAVTQPVPGHPDALSPQGTPPHNATCYPSASSFIHCGPPPPPSNSWWNRPWASAEGSLWLKAFWTIASLEVYSQLLESSFKNRNSCGKNCGQSHQTTARPTSFSWKLISEKWSVSSGGRGTPVPSKGAEESCGGWWPHLSWPCLTCQQETDFIAKLSLFLMCNGCLIHIF